MEKLNRNVSRRVRGFTPLQMSRIYDVTMKIMNGIEVDTKSFDYVIELIDLKMPGMKFEDLYRLAESFNIRRYTYHYGKGGRIRR